MSIFKLNESGQPLALPWIEQEEMIWKNDGGPFGPVSAISAARDFYQSPFDPERDLVGETALFEGWKRMEILSGSYPHRFFSERGEYGFQFEVYRNGDAGVSLHSDSNHIDEYDMYFHNQKTLSDFINDFARAGIELTWTPYAIQQLTGEGA